MKAPRKRGAPCRLGAALWTFRPPRAPARAGRPRQMRAVETQMPPAGDLRLRERGALPRTVDPGRAEQTVTGTASVDRDTARSVRNGGPGAGPLPRGWADGAREGRTEASATTALPTSACSPN